MPTQQQKIIQKIKEILENSPRGVRYSDLVKAIQKELPQVNINTIHGTIWRLKQKIDGGEIKDISRPEHGLYILSKYLKDNQQVGIEKEVGIDFPIKEIVEEDFYKPFADYLVNDLEECTKAIPLGGNKFQDRWGTPDVIGTYKILGMGGFQPPVEIISAEIKIDTNQLITAFGQACAYKIFSHKVYLVIPKQARSFDIKRVESLCLKFGIGLILFDKTNRDNPNFEILTRAVKSEPDYFYVNKYLRILEAEARELF